MAETSSSLFDGEDPTSESKFGVVVGGCGEEGLLLFKIGDVIEGARRWLFPVEVVLCGIVWRERVEEVGRGGGIGMFEGLDCWPGGGVGEK